MSSMLSESTPGMLAVVSLGAADRIFQHDNDPMSTCRRLQQSAVKVLEWPLVS